MDFYPFFLLGKVLECKETLQNLYFVELVVSLHDGYRVGSFPQPAGIPARCGNKKALRETLREYKLAAGTTTSKGQTKLLCSHYCTIRRCDWATVLLVAK